MDHALRSNRARGFTLPEVLVASAVLGIAMVASLQIASRLRIVERETEHRRCALVEADNWLERLTATPWDELTAEHVAECRLSEHAAQQLPGGELQIELAAEDAMPQVKHIVVEVRWRDVQGQPAAPLRLAAWVSRRDAYGAEAEE
jgi:prepilin-type N-terminal cleavage/methylation domain-containing protein